MLADSGAHALGVAVAAVVVVDSFVGADERRADRALDDVRRVEAVAQAGLALFGERARVAAGATIVLVDVGVDAARGIGERADASAAAVATGGADLGAGAGGAGLAIFADDAATAAVEGVAGDVDANAIDIATMTRTADWILCEFIRINHGLPLEEAQDLVDGISVRQLPHIWHVAGKRRILKEGLSAADKALLLLYGEQNSAVLLEDLRDWIEYSNPSIFKTVIVGLHKQRLLEFDTESESITLSPKGVAYVEANLI